eukprot:2433358-Pleurochrysis_carterae.AAC.2
MTACASSAGGSTLSVSATPREVVDVHLKVTRRLVRRVPGCAATPLVCRPSRRSPLRRGWVWLACVEVGLLSLHPGRHERGDALGTVGSERPPESHAPIHHNSGFTLRIPPHKTLGPQIRLLDRAEFIGRLRVCHVRHRPQPSFPLPHVVAA